MKGLGWVWEIWESVESPSSFECRRNRGLGSSGRDKVGEARERGVGGRSSEVTARLFLCDRSCQQLCQLLRQVADWRSRTFVI